MSEEREFGKGSQCIVVLEYMKTVGPISARVASQQLGIDRLAARIADLRKAGFQIHSEMVTKTSARTGYKTRFAEYTLEEN